MSIGISTPVEDRATSASAPVAARETVVQRSARAVSHIVMASGTVIGAVTVGVVDASAAPTADVHYVALGDSFAAGAVNLPQSDLLTCARARDNYPALVARALNAATFTDVTCSNATLENLTAPQPGVVLGVAPPQLDALTTDTTLVTLTMGGNDIGLADDAIECVNPLPEPLGASCADRFTAGGNDYFADRIQALAPAYDRALDDIHARAPKADILIVGYPTASRPGGCPEQPAWARDVDYLQNSSTKLNDLLRATATRHGARYVDTALSSTGHDMCAAPDQQWINGVIPSLSTPSLFPVHPNTLGQQNMARQVLNALG